MKAICVHLKEKRGLDGAVEMLKTLKFAVLKKMFVIKACARKSQEIRLILLPFSHIKVIAVILVARAKF